ncbi:hypothetical protein JCGZ_23421 [Jatropha curcas]|uniref:FRIGIDA-like protein n=1 Tax=Jatropha curcas TaxID=180498 RepID=A0A067JL65_JATCU|nr:hypothetical protein JCGZ_23421 [Jatropha curcas]
MKVDAEHYLEVLGFLQLLASYGLVSEFDADELFTQLEVVAQHSQAELLRVLGFADKISAKFKKGNSNMKGKLAASACKIQRPPWRKMKNLPRIVHGVDAPARAPKSASTKIPALTCFPTTTSTSLPAPMTQSQQQNGIKSSWIAMSEYDLNTSSGADQATCIVPFPVQIEKSSPRDSPFERKEASSSLDPQPKPKCFSFDSNKDDLRRLLTMDESHDLASKVAAALQLAFDPGKLVLDVMNTSHPFDFRGNRDMKVKRRGKRICTLLGKKTGKNGMDPLEVICFLHFLAAYSLASTFTADLLLVLLDADDWHEKVPELVQALGLAEMIPNFIKNLIKKKQRIVAVKYIFALDMVDKFPPVSILKDHLSNSAKELQNENRNSTKVQIRAIDRELNALKAVWKCIADYNIQGLSPEPLSPVSATTQPQHQNGNKRPRIYASSRDLPNMNAPSGHYNRASYPTNNTHPNCYNPNVNSSHHKNTFGYPGHNKHRSS